MILLIDQKPKLYLIPVIFTLMNMNLDVMDTIQLFIQVTDEKFIKLWCLAIAITGGFCHDKIYCHIDMDEMLFESDEVE